MSEKLRGEWTALREALAAAPSEPPSEVGKPCECKCYEYVPDRSTAYADVMTGGDGKGWTVTEDCPIHRKGLVAEREVGEGLREAADEINQCLQIIVTNAGNIVTFNAGELRDEDIHGAALAIEKAVERAKKATWAALAAPAPKPAPPAEPNFAPHLDDKGNPIVCAICHDDIPLCEPGFHTNGDIDKEPTEYYHETCSYQRTIRKLIAEVQTLRRAAESAPKPAPPDERVIAYGKFVDDVREALHGKGLGYGRSQDQLIGDIERLRRAAERGRD